MNQQQIPVTAQQREALFIDLYQKVFPAVAKYIAKRGGSFDDAKDVFQDSIIIYYEKVLCAGTECANQQGYLMGIARHLWLKKFNSNKEQPLDELLTADLIENEQEEPSSNKVLHYLEKAGQKCMDLLKAFYYDHIPVQDLADKFGYSGVRSATVQKYRCLEKVRDTVKQKSLQYEDFIE